MIAVLGASGQLGSAFIRLLGDEAHAVDRSSLDLRDVDGIDPWLDAHRPELVINCAAYTAVDEAEGDPEGARSVNATAVGALAGATAERGVGLVTFSTDFVFDGTSPRPYVESDIPRPLNVYGFSKLEGERLASTFNEGCLVVRTSWLLSATHRNFATTMVDLISRGPVKVVDDQLGRPTIADDLASGVMSAVALGASGILHLTNRGKTTRYHLAREIARFAGLDGHRIEATTAKAYSARANRPANSVLDSERLGELGLAPLPHYLESLESVVGEIMRRN